MHVAQMRCMGLRIVMHMQLELPDLSLREGVLWMCTCVQILKRCVGNKNHKRGPPRRGGTWVTGEGKATLSTSVPTLDKGGKP